MQQTSTLLEDLNEQQRLAVTSKDGPVLVVAGAGSGKTRIITTRIAYMIEQGISPYQILAVTFTNKAAAEMRQRVQNLVNAQVNVGTFHATCMRILRAHADLIDRGNDFTIYDGDDQLAVIKESMKECDVDVKAISPKSIRERISRCKDELQRPIDVQNESADYEDRFFIPVFKRYEEKLKQNNALDFGDLIAKTVLLFGSHEPILEHYRERYRYILVDEFQDTNYAQYMFVHMLASKYRNIMVVGDPDQSIYEWRGANIENILKFEKVFDDVRVIPLEQNYRSTNNILKASNAIISHNSQRKDKNLWSENGDGGLIVLNRLNDEKEEARFMVAELSRLKQKGVALKNMAAFYRTHSQSRVLEEELIRHNIPYRVVGGVKFYSRKEVKDILAYMKIIHNENDEVSLLRVINLPKRAIGKGALDKLKAFARQNHTSLYGAVKAYVTQGLAKGKLKAGLNQFVSLIEKFKNLAINEDLAFLLERVLDETGYVKMLENEATLESRVRIENIKEFYGSVLDFEKSLSDDQRAQALGSYLEYITLQTDMADWAVDGDLFTLMTLHSAKGLEFPVVFMLGMEEGILPHMNSINASFRELEEERRLCYVGITRAMKELYLTCVSNRKQFGFSRVQLPSRFLTEIPAELIKGSMEEIFPQQRRYEFNDFDDYGEEDDYSFF